MGVIYKREFCFVRLVILMSMMVCIRSTETEPVCTSRFDYDHKMLHKMLMLEIEQTKLKEIIEDQRSILRDMEQRIAGENDRTSVLERQFQRIAEAKSFEQSGSTYIRWGRTTCPENGTQLVYKGYAGGSLYSNKGAASNFLCLPEEPIWNVFEDTEQTTNGVYGVEYEFHFRNMNNFFGKSLKEMDVPCCVCQTKRTALLMIPGRNRCYSGWTLEYQGYLVAGHDGHNGASEFICLDEAPEELIGGVQDSNGKLMYLVEARCGSLRCPPYVNGRELTCAVCSK